MSANYFKSIRRIRSLNLLPSLSYEQADACIHAKLFYDGCVEFYDQVEDNFNPVLQYLDLINCVFPSPMFVLRRLFIYFYLKNILDEHCTLSFRPRNELDDRMYHSVNYVYLYIDEQYMEFYLDKVKKLLHTYSFAFNDGNPFIRLSFRGSYIYKNFFKIFDLYE